MRWICSGSPPEAAGFAGAPSESGPSSCAIAGMESGGAGAFEEPAVGKSASGAPTIAFAGSPTAPRGVQGPG
eukprot:745350-Pyramimonas_sp.AAC.1